MFCFSLLNSYLDLNFEVIKKADISRYANGTDIRFVNLGIIAFFSNFKLTMSSGKHFQDFSYAHIVSFLHKVITGVKSFDDLSIGFDRKRNRRRNVLSNNKIIQGKYRLRIMLRVVFVFAAHQKKSTYGLGFKLTLTRNKYEAVLDKVADIADARIKLDHIHWYVHPYTPSIQHSKVYYLNEFLVRHLQSSEISKYLFL